MEPDMRAMLVDAVQRSLHPGPAHNTPGIPPLTPEEELTVEAGRQALAVFRKTFDFWMSVACALHVLKAKAEGLGGRKTFDTLRTREGLGPEVIHKSRVSRLLTILSRIDEVESWRAGLTDAERIEWASSEAIYKHCPLFRPEPKTGAEDEAMAAPRPSAKAQLANALSEASDLASLVERLERELAASNDEVTDLQRQVTLLQSEMDLLRKRAQAAEQALDRVTSKARTGKLKAVRKGEKTDAERSPATAEAGTAEPVRKRARPLGRALPDAGHPAAG